MDDKQIDKQQLRSAFNRSAERYDEVAVLQREVASRMLERLELVKIEPKTILDLGTGTGQCVQWLMKRYRKAKVIGLDLAEAMLPRVRAHGSLLRKPGLVCGDIERLPLADKSVDLIVSSLALQWMNSIDEAFAEIARVLRPGGLLMFTTLGPDTLKELRLSWEAVDNGSSHVNRFLDMHDVGDALMQAGFDGPVVDIEHMVVTYDKVSGLMSDLKTLGAHNVTSGRSRGMTGKERLKMMCEAYEQFRDSSGKLPATYEVVYGHAWAAEAVPEGGSVVQIPIDQIKR
ncbi:malonyl-[acyl-carrier protein] O-methyltransferase BioC [Solemya pervernicosa gill symbiont]|uniref:Malonyl-[acyl-carrier protein] O-methyltransferase n=2 Tax=Gammaproteobacteria incertae sedis TaxID=118884 RepID=A0A1T2LB88_9GAMM|nr:malonyl-[acyl-carrier protein] O-methyltransferase BioC [Solemya pervernicosa gill symbiont]QKQ28160.1 malonyl-ACP O-methyltransferase BioC [Candidatus Reidiella endopervernicosa]